ncbi:MAG: acetylxylan esterase [Cyclobacteriaceae bacterium]|nr:acetylxylan esterase [Cyclobacteriaceae bacterium]
MRILTLLFLFLFTIDLPVSGQSTNSQIHQPLEEVIEQIQQQFDVKIRYSEGLLKDKELRFAPWRVRNYDLQQTLINVLAPFDLVAHPEPDGNYRIRIFDFTRKPVPDGQAHLEHLKNQYHHSKAWERRKSELRQCMMETLGLNALRSYSMPAAITGKRRNFEGYSVQNIALETLPGLFMAGSVYMPLKRKGPFPVILSPNGHFPDGRYRDDQQLRCAGLARMGAIVVSYDMFAWGESELQFAKEHHSTPIAQVIQSHNSIRLLDYMLSLKDADPSRVAITGASGGATQAMVLAALDDRITVSIPVVMVSSHFHGGCPCESGLPVHLCGEGTNNAEIAAMVSPKPMLLVSNGKDWTHTNPELEYPFIKRIYGFYNKADLVSLVHLPEEGHDYGPSKRAAVYSFAVKHLQLDQNAVFDANGQLDEKKCTIEPYKALKVFGDNGEKLPAHALKDIKDLQAVVEKFNNR